MARPLASSKRRRRSPTELSSLDRTTVAANATRHRMVNLDTVEKRLEILDREIREAEQAEASTLATVSAPWNENSFTEAKRAKGKKDRQIPKERFTYDPSTPSYRCPEGPEGKSLTYRERTTKQKANGDYFTIETYQADPSDCAACPLKASCVRGQSGARTVRQSGTRGTGRGIEGNG